MPEKERKEKMSEVPKFDHSKPCMKSESASMRVIIQDGHMFTNADFDRESGKMIPEPVYIPPGQKTAEELKSMLEMLLLDMGRFQSRLEKFEKAMLTNVPNLYAAIPATTKPESQTKSEEPKTTAVYQRKAKMAKEIPPGFKKGPFGRPVPIESKAEAEAE